MTESATPRHTIDIYTPTRRRQLMISIVSLAILTPVLFVDYLGPIETLFPVVALLGIYLVRSGRPNAIPTWIVFNSISFYLIVYAAYSFGTMLPPTVLALFLLGMVVYDIAGVKGGQMQSMATRMISYGIPLFVLIPHSPKFSFERFREIVGNEGLDGLHESKHGISMLGVGDGFLPAALAVSVGSVGTPLSLGVTTATIPQITTIIGAGIGLGLLLWAELPRAIAALIVSVPGALIGLGTGILIETILSV